MIHSDVQKDLQKESDLAFRDGALVYKNNY